MGCCYYSIDNKWSKIPYGDNKFTPIGETPSGGGWPLVYFKRNSTGGFADLNGNPISFNIKVPEQSDGFNTIQLAEVEEVSANLTEEQKRIATFWGTGVPQNQFNPMMQNLINQYKVPVVMASRMYSIIDNAINDAMIICWYYKYLFEIPRPIQYNREFKPYLNTPSHPSYPAGHSVYAGCMDVLLSYFFPDEAENIKGLCNTCSISRLYAGVHYMKDLEEGYNLGEDIALKVIKIIKSDCDSYGCSTNLIFKK